MTENNPQPIDENLFRPTAEAESKDLVSLTDQNWLFINAFLQCGNISKAYKIAGYRGETKAAPYVLFKHLKSRIEDLGNLDVTSRARLQADLKSVLDLPLSASKKELTLSEWLRVRKFAASMTPEASSQKPQISVLVINRPSKTTLEPGKGDKSITPQSLSPGKDVVDAEIVEPNG